MNAEQIKNVEAWVAALRSGKFKQGIAHLRFRSEGAKEFAYCCLGIACDLQSGEWWNDTHHSLGNLSETLSADGRERYGMSEAFETQLIQKNDGGESFEQIADYIETRLREVQSGNTTDNLL